MEKKPFLQNCLIKYGAVLVFLYFCCVFSGGVCCTLNSKQQTGVPSMLEVQSPLHVMSDISDKCSDTIKPFIN